MSRWTYEQLCKQKIKRLKKGDLETSSNLNNNKKKEKRDLITDTQKTC